MNLEDELNELLAGLGVVLEANPEGETGPERGSNSDDEALDASDRESAVHDEADGLSELCLFQTSRDHYGVFYRLDLVDGGPQLRVFMPDERGAVKMRGFLVRPTAFAPVSTWFVATNEHGGSEAFDDAREATQQHLLFAAGELLKRLFWAGEPETMCFPAEIAVRRLV
jgi:hypothetical protein